MSFCQGLGLGQYCSMVWPVDCGLWIVEDVDVGENELTVEKTWRLIVYCIVMIL